MPAPAGVIEMSEEDLAAAEARTSAALANHDTEKEAARQLYADRVAAGGVALDPATALDRGIPKPGSTGLPTVEEFAAETEGRANLDIMLGLREIEGAESVRWQIFRLSDPTGRKPTGYVTEWSSDVLSTARLQEDFGSGTYRIVGKRSNGQYAAMRTVKIAEDSRTPTAPQNEPENNSGSGSNSMQEFMVMMAQQSEARRQEDQERERREEARDERRRKERMELMQIAAPIVAAVVPALFNRGPDLASLLTAMRPAPQPTLIETMAALRELTPPPAAPAANPLEAGLKIFDAISERVGNTKGESGWLDVVREGMRAVAPALSQVAGPLAKMAAQRQAQQAHPQPRAPQRASIAGPPDLHGGMPSREPMENGLSSVADAQTDSAEIQFHPGDAPGEGEDVNLFQKMKMIPWLCGQLDMLVTKAAKDSDPELYAEVVIDSIPEDVPGDNLLEFLNSPNWFETMAQFDSRVETHREWFEELRTEIFKTAADIKSKAQVAAAPRSGVPAAIPAVPMQPDKPKGPPSLG